MEMKGETNPDPKILFVIINVLHFLSKCCHLDIELMKIYKSFLRKPQVNH